MIMTNDINMIDEDMEKKIRGEVKFLLRMYFPDGFRLNSTRDLLLLKSHAEDEQITLPDDETLKEKILAVGVVLCEVIFVIRGKLNKIITDSLRKIHDSGAQIIFYEAMMNTHREILNGEHIYSVELFRDLLSHVDDKLLLHDEFFTFNELSTVSNDDHQRKLQDDISNFEKASELVIKTVSNDENLHQAENKVSSLENSPEPEANSQDNLLLGLIVSEIKRVWGDDKVSSLDEISQRLIYVPANEIKSCLDTSPEFVKVSDNKFFLMDKFIISAQERKDILDFVKSACETEGFVALINIPCENIRSENYELTGNTIYTAIFNSVLTGKFQLRSKIITQTGENINVNDILRNFCRDKTECSIDELSELYEGITGGVVSTEILRVLYSSMIRIDEKNFVADELISFNVDEIDEVLKNIIAGKKFIPVQSIISFAMFPDCGQSWNNYLLESFCYRFSKKFSLKVPSFNSKNIGIISEKKNSGSYDDILAKILVRENVRLNEEEAGQYLFENGYTGRVKFPGLRDIIKSARKN